MKLDALIFDLDGTIAETEEIHRQAFNHAFRKAGLNWYWSRLLYGDLLSVTGGKERIRYFIDQYSPAFPKLDRLTEFIADLHQVKTEKFHETLLAGRIPLRPGVKRLVLEAREAGVRLGIATTTTASNVTILLETSLDPKAPGWFDVIAAGNVVPRKKPAPDIYEYALKVLGASPDSCLAIEDSENGLRASLGTGLKTVVTTNQYTQAHDFSGACLVLDHLGEPNQAATALVGQLAANTYVDLNQLARLLD